MIGINSSKDPEVNKQKLLELTEIQQLNEVESFFT